MERIVCDIAVAEHVAYGNLLAQGGGDGGQVYEVVWAEDIHVDGAEFGKVAEGVARGVGQNGEAKREVGAVAKG